MKHNYIYLFLVIFANTLGVLNGQDTIKLKTGQSIPASIIQMDFQNIYYKNWDNEKGKIKSVTFKNISEVIFESYPKSKLDSLTFASKSKIDTIKRTNSKIKGQKPLVLGFSIFPILDVSADIDVSSNFGLEFGIGLGYIYTGTRFYPNGSKRKNRFYGGAYLYRFKIFKWTSTAIYLPFGYNHRAKSGLNFKAELGLLMGSDFIFIMPKIGFGIRF